MSLDFTIRPDVCDKCGRGEQEMSFNITHNLGKMADAAGIYKCLWRPEENGFEKAEDIIPLLETGIKDMESRPVFYKTLEAENLWGLYKDFVPWVKTVLEHCKENPKAMIESDR